MIMKNKYEVNATYMEGTDKKIVKAIVDAVTSYDASNAVISKLKELGAKNVAVVSVNRAE